MDLIQESLNFFDKDFLVEESINDKYNFKSVFMAGGPGSGKSFIGDKMFKGLPVIQVNTDFAFETFLEKVGLPFEVDPKKDEIYAEQMKYREKGKALTDIRAGHWINGMLPLVVDGTGRKVNKISKQYDMLTEMGYDCSMVFVNTSLEVAIERNRARARKLDDALVIKAWNDVQNNIGAFQDVFGSRDFHVIDNSEIAEDIRELETTLVRKAMSILNEPLRNPKGILILEKMREVGAKYLTDLGEKLVKDFL